MSKSSNSLRGIAMVVIFLVLIAIAATLYGNGEEEKAQSIQNSIVAGAFSVVDFFSGKTDLSFKGITGATEEASSAAENKRAEDADEINESWQEIKDKVNNKMSGDEVFVESEENVDLEKFFRFEKTDNGSAIVFRSKNGEERRIAWPSWLIKEQSENIEETPAN